MWWVQNNDIISKRSSSDKISILLIWASQMCVLISLRCIRAKLEHHGNSLDSSFKTHFIDSHKFERIAKLLKRVSSRNASLFVLGGNRIMCDRCRARPETETRSRTGDERDATGTRPGQIIYRCRVRGQLVTKLYWEHTHTHICFCIMVGISHSLLLLLYKAHLLKPHLLITHFGIFRYYFVPLWSCFHWGKFQVLL